MWVRRDGDGIDSIALTGARAGAVEDVLLPHDEAALMVLGAMATGGSQAHLYVCSVSEDREDLRLVVCLRGADGAVRVEGRASMVADTLYARTRAALLAMAKSARDAGRQDEARHWSVLARRLLMTRRQANRGSSVRAMAGGLPTLGCRR
jgi:hypothetical protein